MDGDLRFELLAVKEGFGPVFAKHVDDLHPAAMILRKRTEANGIGRSVRGRVVEEGGVALRDAVVKPLGVLMADSGDKAGKVASIYGEVEGVESIAVTDRNGEFELNSLRPALGMLLQVETPRR